MNSDTLFKARLELASRGEPPWAAALARFERFGALLPDVPSGDFKDLCDEIAKLSTAQRHALGRLINDLTFDAAAAEPQPPGCNCDSCRDEQGGIDGTLR